MRNIFYALLLAAALAPLLLAADFIGVALRIPSIRKDLSLNLKSKSVTTIDYSSLRNPSIRSSISAKNFSPLAVTKLPYTEHAMPWMPLYVNVSGNLESSKSIRLLFFATQDGYLDAYSLDREEIMWSLPIPEGMRVANSPVIDLVKNKIYFLAIPEDQADPMRLFSADFHGEHIESIEIQPSDVIEDKLLTSLSCDSPLSLVPGPDPTIIFSCLAHFKKKKFHVVDARFLVSAKMRHDESLSFNANIESLRISDQDAANSASNQPIILSDQKVIMADAVGCLSRFSIENKIILEEVWPCEEASHKALAIAEQENQHLAFFSFSNTIQAFDPTHFANRKISRTGPSALSLICVANGHYLLSQDESVLTLRKLVGRELGEIVWTKPNTKMSTAPEQLVIENKQPDQFLYIRVLQSSPSSNHLEVIDGSNGDTLQTLELPVDTYPSAPLLVDEDIYLATKSSGILRLSREESFVKLLSSNSVFRVFWVNLFAQMKKI